jgi:type IV secretory pathway VirB4 component
VFGTTGCGKSFAAALLGLRSRWRDPGLDLVFLDPLGEFGRLAEALGGAALSLGHPGAPRLNPLDPVTTAGDRLEKSARVSTMLRALFPSLRDEEGAELDSAVHRLFEAGPASPTCSRRSKAPTRGGTGSGRYWNSSVRGR